MKRQLYIDHRAKATNESVILIVDHLYTAIIERKKVTFQYFDYTPKKEVHRHGGQLYAVSPYAMLWNNDQYYMVGYSIDRFGEDVCGQIVDREHFKVTATVALSNNFYGWVFASEGKMRILEPEKAKAQFNNILGNFSV